MTTARAAEPSRDDARPRSGRGHLHALTGLRLVAALAVYLSHLPQPVDAPVWLRTMQQSGYAGVTFFFILSGFVLTLNYVDDLRTPRQVWSYAVARVARIYPLYLTVLAWSAVGVWASGDLPEKVLMRHLLGLQAWSGDIAVAYAFVGPAWSISVEIFLYAVLPLLVALVRLLDRRIWFTVAALAAVVAALAVTAHVFETGARAALHWTDPGSAQRWLYRTPLTRIGDFLLGILAARTYAAVRQSPVAARLGGWLIPPAMVVTLCFAASPGLLNTAWSWDALYAAPATALILGLALAPGHPASRLLARRPVVFLGEASFAFYLVHRFAIDMTGAGTWQDGVTPARVLLEALNFGVAVALAIGLHVGVEKPARPLVRRLLDPPPRVAPPPDAPSPVTLPRARVPGDDRSVPLPPLSDDRAGVASRPHTPPRPGQVVRL